VRCRRKRGVAPLLAARRWARRPRHWGKGGQETGKETGEEGDEKDLEEVSRSRRLLGKIQEDSGIAVNGAERVQESRLNAGRWRDK